MYYILTNQAENDEYDAILEGESIYLDRIDCSFQEGLPLPMEDIDTPIPFKLNEYTLRGTMTDRLSLDDIPGPVCSLRAKFLFEKIGITNVEYYQLSIQDEFVKDKEGDKSKSEQTVAYTNYFIANVVGLVDCVDHEKSEIEYFLPPELRNRKEDATTTGIEKINDPFAGDNPNEIDFITKLVFDESKIDPAIKIFRLLDQPNLLVFHESVVGHIRKAGLSGFVFVPVSEYTDAIADEEEDEEQEKKEPKKEIAPMLKQPDQKDEPVSKEPKLEEIPKEIKKTRFSFLD